LAGIRIAAAGGRCVWPKAYPDELLADFRRHFREEWLPNRAIDYFRGRDSEALQFLPKLIAANKPKSLIEKRSPL